jgi:hypothetical protein
MKKQPTIADRILTELRRRGPGGATDEQLAETIGSPENSIRPARVRLVDAKKIRPASFRRKTKTGSRAHVWTPANLPAAGDVKIVRNHLPCGACRNNELHYPVGAPGKTVVVTCAGCGRHYGRYTWSQNDPITELVNTQLLEPQDSK